MAILEGARHFLKNMATKIWRISNGEVKCRYSR